MVARAAEHLTTQHVSASIAVFADIVIRAVKRLKKKEMRVTLLFHCLWKIK
jgi:hypothetical protein